MDEFTVRLAPAVNDKKYTVFKLHRDDNVPWTEAKMRRDNDNQPWQIKLGTGRSARRFKAIKEGGVNDNASYFVFYKPTDKSNNYEVCPIEEWYSVSATQRYKTLTAEEAEQKFEQRHKMLNLFSVMHLKNSGENGEEGGSVSDRKAFKVSEMDDWNNSGDEDDLSGEDNDEEGRQKKKNRKKKGIKKEREDPNDAPDEAKEDSDEGDYEQREVDYMSSSSSSDSEANDDNTKDETDVKGIAEEEALRNLLTDNEDDDDGVQPKGNKMGNEEGVTSEIDLKQNPDADDSEDSSDSDDYDVDDDKLDNMLEKKNNIPSQLTRVKQEVTSSPEVNPSTSNNNTKPSVSNNKRKAPPEVPITSVQPSKRLCSTEVAQSPEEKVIEDLVRKYLSRKPMTAKTLLKEIKSKLRRLATPEMDSNKLVQILAVVIKRLNVEKQKVNDQIYLWLKS